MSEKEEVKKPLRKIIIETDGDMIHIALSEMSGILEFKAVLQTILDSFSTGQVNRPKN